MCPREYRIGARRQLGTQATRTRIIEAARALLADGNATVFTVDAVAVRADVARMTVYYQFKSKGGLLEAVFDDFGTRAKMKNLREAFADPNPAQGLNTLIEIFCNLWKRERAILRRLNAIAVLDAEVGKALEERNSWRREAIGAMVRRQALAHDADDVVDLLCVLTSFATYDDLATAGRTSKNVATLLCVAAAGALERLLSGP